MIKKLLKKDFIMCITKQNYFIVAQKFRKNIIKKKKNYIFKLLPGCPPCPREWS